MINVISTFNDLFAFMGKEKHWFTMLAFIYIRVAAPATSSSLGAQRKSLISYAEKLGLKHVFILEETGSAHQAGRSPFKEMVEFYETQVREGACPALIVDSFARLTLDFQDAATMYSLIYERSLEIHVVKENRVLSDTTPPSDFLMNDTNLTARLFASFGQAGD